MCFSFLNLIFLNSDLVLPRCSLDALCFYVGLGPVHFVVGCHKTIMVH